MISYIDLLAVSEEKSKRIKELESYNLALANESHAQQKRIAELEEDISFLQSCVNSGETANIEDRPSEQAKQSKSAINLELKQNLGNWKGGE